MAAKEECKSIYIRGEGGRGGIVEYEEKHKLTMEHWYEESQGEHVREVEERGREGEGGREREGYLV
jgi:hypothetical protein